MFLTINYCAITRKVYVGDHFGLTEVGRAFAFVGVPELVTLYGGGHPDRLR
jgi:hypothetical protein